ncbi:hypothetical protein [Rhizobium lentis]|uniref:Uncharacterized protein n=1 Tax=Rhizobium lentis TaxID=1138194 RepID=A0ABS7IMA3_9HYPH|nr:hypothetical protein [Rhizobium lentis]MBX4959069.1 hypothetical protein [Rhizobium lentis]MBX4972670.1 hypothetical protein [Rhizobium lentis]MBX4989075.1 hypothetical protein [Rhizobium lentis]MBX4998576.1 hypothetical protein [Rhizobium lentis]MBX5007524.1 hypothetical protein [Rhizobium lentis]
MVNAHLFFAKVPLLRHAHVIFEIYRCSQEDRHEQLPVAAGRTRDDPFDLPGAMLTTDELAVS